MNICSTKEDYRESVDIMHAIPDFKTKIMFEADRYPDLVLEKYITKDESIFKEIIEYKDNYYSYLYSKSRIILDNFCFKNKAEYKNIYNIELSHVIEIFDEDAKEIIEEILRKRINLVFEKYSSPYRYKTNSDPISDFIENTGIKIRSTLNKLFNKLN